MKKVLITGASSRVGICVENWLNQWPEKYCVEKIHMSDGTWRSHDFSTYDCVFHVAGIAHVTLDPAMENLFYSVNRDLTIEVASVAKSAGVKQFIFMSSGIVYGDSSLVGVPFVIEKNTPAKPTNFYGRSKLEAEEGLHKLNDDSFKVVIIRSPALYGIGMKSHYNNLSMYARKYHFFPKVNNQRSMLYNKNLAEFVKLLIDNEDAGIFWPQNKEYTSTMGIIRDIANEHNHKMFFIPGLSPLVRFLSRHSVAFLKAFGNFTYDFELSKYKENYCLFSYKESIHEIETSEEELVVGRLV